MAIRPIAPSLPGERVLALSPGNATQAATFWQRRPNMFAGRALSAGALAQRQAWQAGHIAQRGQHRGPGTLQGFEAVLRADAGATGFERVTVTIGAGSGLAVTGEDVVLRQPLATTLAEVPVVAPPGFFIDGSGVGDPEADAALNPRVIGAALGALDPASRATLPAVGVLLLQPCSVDTSDFDPLDPCDRSTCDEDGADDTAAFEDWRSADAARLLWYVWPTEWRALPSASIAARNALAWTVFQAEAALPPGAALPWEEWGVPVALVQLDLAAAQVAWVDRASVVRRGGLAPDARLQLALGDAGAPLLAANNRLAPLQQAQIEQFAEEVAALSGTDGVEPDVLAQPFASFLPPVGLLPRNCYDPAARRSAFFPIGFDLDAVPVPVEQIDIVIRANASLAPLNLLSAESVRVLVPVPLASWEPRLLNTQETPDAEFQRTLDRFLLARARALGQRQGLRVRQSLLRHALSGAVEDVAAWDLDDAALEPETLAPWGPPPAGGGHRSALVGGLHQHAFEGATATFAAGSTSLFCWVYLDPENPPRSLMLQWHVAGADWEHRAYWGENLIALGLDDSASRAHIGELPQAGAWTRLEVRVDTVALSGAALDGMAFSLFDGRAAFGVSGSGAGPDQRPWFGSKLPAGAQGSGDEGWDVLSGNDLWAPFEAPAGIALIAAAPAPFAFGAHADTPARGLHAHSYDSARAPAPAAAFAVQSTEQLFCWVYLDPNDPPREIALRWRMRDGNIARLAYWGWNAIASAAKDSSAGVHAGALPEPGTWTRLEVAVSALELGGAALTGLDFMQFDGSAAFGPAGAFALAADGTQGAERNWITITDAPDGGPTTNPGWTIVPPARAASPTSEADIGQVQALRDLAAHPALQVLSAPERVQLFLRGAVGFSAYLKSRTDRADDLVDYGFVKVQTDVYRVRQLMLGTTAATRLAVSPVLATIAQAETATASQERISSFIADLRKKVVVTPSAAPASPAPASPARVAAGVVRSASATPAAAPAGTSGPLAQRAALIGSRVDSGVISIGGNSATRVGGSAIGSTLGNNSGLISTGLLERIGTQTVVEDTRRLGDIGLIGGARLGGAALATPTPSDVANADPLAGSAFIRTTTIAQRLEDPKSKEARDYATSSRYEAVLALVRLADALSAEDGGVTPGLFDGIQLHGLQGDTFLDDLKPPNGGAAPLERPFTDFLRKRELLGALLKVPSRLPAGQTNGDPDEAAMFSDSTDLSDHVVALMRKVEGRIKLYRDAIAACDAVAAQLRSALAAVAARIAASSDDLAEARHDTGVARSLLAEETARLAEVNARRLRVLAEEVKFLVFMRPRETDSLLATPTHAVDPGLLDAPVPACLHEHPDVPDEIADMLRVLREAPANWFVTAPPILQQLDRAEPLLRLLQIAKTRAGAGLATPIVSAAAGLTGIGQAAAKVATRQVQALAPRIGAVQALDLATLSQASWQGQQARAEQLVSFGDLADGGHGRADVARSAAAELDHIRSIVVCLHAEFSGVLPALRLQWAENLSEFDAAPSLRNLASLPRWSEIDVQGRRRMQSYVDWLFGQVASTQPQAVALMNDVLRMCLLLASHAPVDRIISGRLARPVPTVVTGTRIPLVALDPSRLRIGMQAVVYRGEQVVARALVEDIGNDEASARVVETLSASVQLDTDVRIHFESSAAVSLAGASQRRSLFGR